MLFISMVLFSTSCNNHVKRNNTQSSKPKVDTLWNDRVQDTFFGATLGEDISVVKEKFVKHGFLLVSSISTDNVLHFKSPYSSFFAFGNMTWQMLDVYAINGRFSIIEFKNSSEDKESALRSYETIKNAVSEKYRLTNFGVCDSIIYARSDIFGRNDTRAVILCEKCKTISGKYRFMATLMYATKDLGGVSDEL